MALAKANVLKKLFLRVQLILSTLIFASSAALALTLVLAKLSAWSNQQELHSKRKRRSIERLFLFECNSC